jgi:hypothetical protein
MRSWIPWLNWLRMVCKMQEMSSHISYIITGDIRGAIGNAIPPLIQHLDDSDPRVRHTVVETIVELARNGT